MKKITFAFILSAGVFAVFSAHNKAEALSIAPSKLSFWNITQTGLTAAYNPAGGPLDAGLEEARFRKASIYLNYRPTMCGDDPATPPSTPCPAIYMAPTTIPFGYSATPNPSLLPAYITGLKPATSYTFWISYDNGIRCITTPCPSTTDDFANRAIISTTSDVQATGQTQPKFSEITKSSATVGVSVGNDNYRSLVDRRAELQIRYIQDSLPQASSAASSSINYQIRPFQYVSDIYNPLPMTLSGLNPNTTYRVWLGYNPNPSCASGTLCPLTGIPFFWENSSYTFTTAGAEAPSGSLTQKLYLGIKSPEVALLQQFLIKEGYLAGSADGSFGPMTHSAVRRFQVAFGLSVDGRVGPNTRSIINKLIRQ